jgi:ABC-2 type transport system permease protein
LIADLRTVLWKELREIPMRRRSGLLSLVVVVGLIGVVLPLQAGLRFFQTGQQVSLVVLPMALIMAVIADSFAGERERHTLETLLASPLSDRTILFGKITAAVAFGWAIALLSLLLGLAMVNLKYGQGKLLLP